jgi:hypothetical protein
MLLLVLAIDSRSGLHVTCRLLLYLVRIWKSPCLHTFVDQSGATKPCSCLKLLETLLTHHIDPQVTYLIALGRWNPWILSRVNASFPPHSCKSLSVRGSCDCDWKSFSHWFKHMVCMKDICFSCLSFELGNHVCILLWTKVVRAAVANWRSFLYWYV